VAKDHDIPIHCYADDTQLYKSFTPGVNEAAALHSLESCIDDARYWMTNNELNDRKTEFIIFGSPFNLGKVATTAIKVGDHHTKARKSAENIAVRMSSTMSIEDHVNALCKSAWFHVFRISKIKHLLTFEQLKSIRNLEN